MTDKASSPPNAAPATKIEKSGTTAPPPPSGAFNRRDVLAFAKMVAPMAFVLTIGIYSHEFVWHAVSVNKAINAGIIVSSSFGVIIILIRLLDAQKDFRALERFGYEAKQGVYMKTMLEETWLRGRYIRHYLARIANTGGTLASELEHSAIESELHALQADYDSRLEFPQFLVGFMIAMGLLGTFIGLLETLTGISSMLDGMGGSGADIQQEFSQLVGKLRQPLNGMGIAFSASMFGLITSLMLSLMMTNLRRYISRVISLARNVMHELTEMANQRRHGKSIGFSPDEIESLKDTPSSGGDPESPAVIQTSARGGGDDNLPDAFYSGPISGSGLDPALAGRFELMTKKMEVLLQAILENTDTQRRLNDLIGFGPRMKEISEKTLEEIKNLSLLTGQQQSLMHTLAEQTIESRQIDIGNGRHLNDIKQNLIKFGQNTAVVEMIATGIGGQTALLETLVEETRRSQQGLAIINKSIVERN